MKRLITVALLVIAGCSPDSQQPPRPYGITPAVPLGVPAALDRRLVQDLDFVKQVMASPSSKEASAIGQSFEYRDVAASKASGRQESVIVLLDAAGRVRGVGGSFSRKGGSETVKKFLTSYWAAVSGEFPEFTDPIDGVIASFYSKTVEGQWTRSAASEQVLINLR